MVRDNVCSFALFCMDVFILEEVVDDREVVCSSSNGNNPLGLTPNNRDLVLEEEAGVDVNGKTLLRF